MNHIYVVRHGKAEGQAPDAPLTAEGAQQAIRLAEWFADKPIDYIVSSPYERAYRSIQPLGDRLGIEVVLDDRLTERVLKHFDDRIGFNEWASMTNPDVYRLSFQTRNPEIQRVWTE